MELYLEEDKTQEELAKLWGCSKPTVASWATRHGLSKKRSPIGQPKGTTPSSILTGAPLAITQIVGTWDVYPEAVKETLRAELRDLIEKLP